MTKDEKTFAQGFVDGFKSVKPDAPIAIPSPPIPAGKTPYEWGFESGVKAAKGGN